MKRFLNKIMDWIVRGYYDAVDLKALRHACSFVSVEEATKLIKEFERTHPNF